jgi:hypothetical protein
MYLLTPVTQAKNLGSIFAVFILLLTWHLPEGSFHYPINLYLGSDYFFTSHMWSTGQEALLAYLVHGNEFVFQFEFLPLLQYYSTLGN